MSGGGGLALPSYQPRLAFQSPAPPATPVLTTSTRPLYLRGNVVSQAVGSATCELGKTKVVCSIHGPRPRKAGGRAEFLGRGAVDVEATFAPFARRAQTKEMTEKANRELSRFLENCLESSVQLWRFPKSVLDVYLVVLEDDGSVFACATLCASFALAKMGVEMVDLVSCCNLYISPRGELAVDPTLDQERSAKATCTIGVLSGSGKLACLDVASQEACDPAVISQFLNMGGKLCLDIAKVMRDQLKQEALEEEQSDGDAL